MREQAIIRRNVDSGLQYYVVQLGICCLDRALTEVSMGYLDNGSRCICIKVCSHMCGAVTSWRRADFDIPAPLPWVCWHIHGADPARSAVCWVQRWFGVCGFEADIPGKLGVEPICCRADFVPTPPLLRDRICVNACNDLCWSQFSICLHPCLLRTCVNVPLNVWPKIPVPNGLLLWGNKPLSG